MEATSNPLPPPQGVAAAVSGPSWQRDVKLGLVVLAVGAGLHGYLGHRLLVATALPAAWATAGWLALGMLLLSLPLVLAAERLRPSRLSRALCWMAYLWLGAVGLLLPAALLAQGVGALLALFVPVVPVQLARVEGLALVLGVLPALTLGVRSARGPARVEQLTVPVAGLAEGLAGLRVVHLSDVHIGLTQDGRFLERVVAQVNALAPDVVAFTGDLVDGPVHALREEVAPLSGLKAPLGVYFVTGNHEYYQGGEAWAQEVRRLGLTVLQNEHRVVERDGARLTVAGVTDFDAGHLEPAHASRPDLALAGAPQGVPRLLLAHQPRTARHLEGLGVDLQLSGHTHGGQFFPFNLLVPLQQPVLQGLAVLHGTRVYTSRGTGYWGPPLRLGPAPEIAVLTLVPA